MNMMLAPVANQSIVTSGGTVYTANNYGVIYNVSTVQDVLDLQAAGCLTLTGYLPDLLFTLKGANFNANTDQQLTAYFSGKWRAKRIVITNASISLTSAVGGFYTAASKGGSALVANTQVYSSLTTALLALEATLALPSLVLAPGTPLYLSLTTPQGGGATGDIYVYGDVYV
jgi:hypothetical protein